MSTTRTSRALATFLLGDGPTIANFGNDGLLVAAPLNEAPVLGGEIGVAFRENFSPRLGHGSGDEVRGQPPASRA